MKLYMSKCNNVLNKKELKVESISEHLCLNPKYKVTIENPNAKILIDSGAFQDRDKNTRITFEEALQRQLKFEEKVGFVSERIVSYDNIDDAETTIAANEFLAERRDELKPRQIVLMIQGSNTDEYIKCLVETLKFAKTGDCIGFGGVALAGKINEMKFKLYDAFKIGLPLIYNAGLRDIHIFGVGTFDVLKGIRSIVNIFNKMGMSTDELNLSCDTSSFELNSTMGRVINLEKEKWEKIYTKEQKYIDYHPCDLTKENMEKALYIINKI